MYMYIGEVGVRGGGVDGTRRLRREGSRWRLSWNRRSLTDGPTVGSSAASAVDEHRPIYIRQGTNVNNSMMESRRMVPVNNRVVGSETKDKKGVVETRS